MFNRLYYEQDVVDILRTIENEKLRIEAILELLEEAHGDGYADCRIENENREPWRY